VSNAPDLSKLSHAEKDALILTLMVRLDEAHKLIAELRARIDDLTRPGKTPDNSSVPPSKGQKPNRPDKIKRRGPRKGSLGRVGGGRALTADPDEVMQAKPARCHYCQHAFTDADQTLDARYDKIDLPRVRPMVTRVERYAAQCRCCGATTLAAVPEGLEPGTPFSLNIVALAMYLRFVHAVSYQRLARLLMELFGLAISEGALDAAFRRGKPRFDADVAAILARLRRARVVYSDETGVRIDGSGHWNWVFQNAEVVIHVVRRSRGADVVARCWPGIGRRCGCPISMEPSRAMPSCGRSASPTNCAIASMPSTLAMRCSRRGAGAATPRSGRQHAARIPPPSGTLARCRHGAGTGQSRRPTIAQALRPGSRPPVHLPRSSRDCRRQQQQRTRTAPDRNIPQGHWRLPLRLGRRPVRRRPLRHRDRRPSRHRRLSGNP
jgi:hypothetical protein